MTSPPGVPARPGSPPESPAVGGASGGAPTERAAAYVTPNSAAGAPEKELSVG